MEINDEMLACYVEGSLNMEERNFVRKYLSENPERLESLLYMIDDNREDYLGEMEESDDGITTNEASFSDIAYSAAAFVPQQKKSSFLIKKQSDSTEDFLGRLGKLCNEIGI